MLGIRREAAFCALRNASCSGTARGKAGNIAKMLEQDMTKKGEAEANAREGALHAFRTVVKEEGFLALYKGEGVPPFCRRGGREFGSRHCSASARPFPGVGEERRDERCDLP